MNEVSPAEAKAVNESNGQRAYLQASPPCAKITQAATCNLPRPQKTTRQIVLNALVWGALIAEQHTRYPKATQLIDGEKADGFTNVNGNQSKSKGGMGYIQSGPPSLARHQQGPVQYDKAVNSIRWTGSQLYKLL